MNHCVEDTASEPSRTGPHSPRRVAINGAVGIALKGASAELVIEEVRDKDQRLPVRGMQPAVLVIFEDDAFAW